jgi:hypothetical protein
VAAENKGLFSVIFLGEKPPKIAGKGLIFGGFWPPKMVNSGC